MADGLPQHEAAYQIAKQIDEEANKKDDYGEEEEEEDESWCGSISTYHSEEERLLKYISFNSVLA